MGPPIHVDRETMDACSEHPDGDLSSTGLVRQEELEELEFSPPKGGTRRLNSCHESQKPPQEKEAVCWFPEASKGTRETPLGLAEALAPTREQYGESCPELGVLCPVTGSEPLKGCMITKAMEELTPGWN